MCAIVIVFVDSSMDIENVMVKDGTHWQKGKLYFFFFFVICFNRCSSIINTLYMFLMCIQHE